MPKFCTNCGAEALEPSRFCRKCGAELTPTQPAPPSSMPTAPPSYQPPFQGASPHPPPQGYAPPPYQAQAASGTLTPNLTGALCYLFVTAIIFLVLDPYNKDRFVRFHAWQAIFFTVAMIALNLALGVLSIALPWFLESLLSAALMLGGIALWVWLIYKAYQNEMFKLPLIGDLAEQQAK